MRKLQLGDCVKDITQSQVDELLNVFKMAPFDKEVYSHAQSLGIYYSDMFQNICIPYNDSTGVLMSNPMPFYEFYEMAKITVQ